jgi:hypothetical protein
LAGLLALLAAAWGGISVFVGPIFGWHPTTNSSWDWTNANWMLHAIPGAVGVVGGLMLLSANPRRRPAIRGIVDLAALLLLITGIWFVIGPALWGTFESGRPFQATTDAANEFWYQLGSSLGPGLALTFFGGMALKAGIARPAFAVADPVADRPVAEDRAWEDPITERERMYEGRPATSTAGPTGTTGAVGGTGTAGTAHPTGVAREDAMREEALRDDAAGTVERRGPEAENL